MPVLQGTVFHHQFPADPIQTIRDTTMLISGSSLVISIDSGFHASNVWCADGDEIKFLISLNPPIPRGIFTSRAKFVSFRLKNPSLLSPLTPHGLNTQTVKALFVHTTSLTVPCSKKYYYVAYNPMKYLRCRIHLHTLLWHLLSRAKLFYTRFTLKALLKSGVFRLRPRTISGASSPYM